MVPPTDDFSPNIEEEKEEKSYCFYENIGFSQLKEKHL